MGLSCSVVTVHDTTASTVASEQKKCAGANLSLSFESLEGFVVLLVVGHVCSPLPRRLQRVNGTPWHASGTEVACCCCCCYHEQKPTTALAACTVTFYCRTTSENSTMSCPRAMHLRGPSGGFRPSPPNEDPTEDNPRAPSSMLETVTHKQSTRGTLWWLLLLLLLHSAFSFVAPSSLLSEVVPPFKNSEITQAPPSTMTERIPKRRYRFDKTLDKSRTVFPPVLPPAGFVLQGTSVIHGGTPLLFLPPGDGGSSPSSLRLLSPLLSLSPRSLYPSRMACW
mmetsp:Transcript_14254/g.32022  ORF Transcript_14254/g.32022 Transcript_14254/m.32022 type:complete len:281 (+) Transcript_14254:115-957(+)